MIATGLSGSVRLGGKSFARVAPSLAPSDRILTGLSGWVFPLYLAAGRRRIAGRRERCQPDGMSFFDSIPPPPPPPEPVRQRRPAWQQPDAVIPGSVAGELIRVAQKIDADLIVAGGYGHSRLGERMFGGVTQGLLTTSPVCCLLSH